MNTITLTNVGPIEHLSIPVHDGVVVFRGRNGTGKSMGLEAVESALTGRGKISVRDGETKAEVSAFGATIRVGRSTRRSGELEVQTLEGKLSVAEFVEPGIKDPLAADSKRTKALVTLSEVEADASLFYPLLGGKEGFESVVGTHALASEDLVQMADRVKRDIEAAARKEEDRATLAEGRSRGAREAASGVDANLPCDADELQAALEAAIREESQVKEQTMAAVRALRQHREAKDALEDAEASYTGPTLDEADDNMDEARQRVELTSEAVTAARLALANAEMEAKASEMALRQAVKQRANAEQHEKMVAVWKEQVAKELPQKVSPERMDWAAKQVQAAREAVEAGVLVRKAKQHLADSQAAAKEAAEHRRAAGELREAAKGTDEILSQLVVKTSDRLRVEAGRLVLDTKRGKTYFADLSHGERWKLGLDVGIEAVGKNGVLVIPQVAWEGLDDVARHEIAEHVAGRGVVVLTAECSDDEEIRAEVFA